MVDWDLRLGGLGLGTCPMMHINFMLARIALSELSITDLMEERTFVSNRCKIEMQISRMQVSLVASLCHDFLEKTHLSQDVTLCLPFYFLKEN